MRQLPARSLAVLVAVVGFAACGDDDAGEAATSSSEPSVTTTSSEPTTTMEESTTTTGEADGVLADARTCTSPDGFAMAYPPDWDAVADCGQFGPAPVEEPTPSTDERPGVISAYVDPVPFEEVSTAAPAAEQERTETEVDGRSAVRVEAVESGDALYPAGTRTVRWMIDLSETADRPSTLFVTAVDVQDDVDWDRAVDVLDAMVDRIRIDTEPTSDGATDPTAEPAD